MTRLVSIALIGSILFSVQCAYADASVEENPKTDPASQPVYKLNLKVDIPVFLLGGFVAVGWVLNDELGSADCAPLCDRKQVNSFDRWSAGYYDENWATITDFTLLGLLGVGVVSLFADEGFTDGLTDFFVIAESVLLTNGFIIALNLVTRRSRPYMYSEKAPESVRNSGTATLSFPSGHVGAATAFTTSVFQVFHARHPKSPWPWVFLGFGTAASGAIMTGRIMAGRHFTSDVLVGAASGICMGILVSALHEKNVLVAPVVSEGGAGLTLTGSF